MTRACHRLTSPITQQLIRLKTRVNSDCAGIAAKLIKNIDWTELTGLHLAQTATSLFLSETSDQSCEIDPTYL